MPTSNQPRKTKIDLTTNQKLKNFPQFSQIVGGTELKTSHDLYNFKDFNKLPSNKKYLALPHMNFSSIPAHTNKVKTFLNFLNIDFNIICIYKSILSAKNSFIFLF